MKLKSVIRRGLDDVQTASIQGLMERIDQYDEVAFDVFDTLIKRDASTPSDVFRMIEAYFEEPDFAAKRIQAERRAREGRSEVTLAEIYDAYPGIDDEKRRHLMDREIEYERNLCVANREMLPVFQYAREKKRVFVISDMYLSRDVIVGILQKNGFDGYDGIVVSNEVDKTKGDGTLFDYAMEIFKLKKALYIGNKFVSDYWMPRRHGLSSEKVRTNTIELSRRYKKEKDDVRDKCLRAFISNHNEDKGSYYYTVGYERFGPLIYGFSNWLYSEVRKDGIEQILFLSRDGYIMRKAFEAIDWPCDIPHRYFEVSRRSLRVPLYCINHDIEKLLDSVFKTADIAEFLDGMGLNIEDYEEVLSRNGFDKTRSIRKSEFTQLPFYQEIERDAIENSRREYDGLKAYLAQFDFSRKTAIVDIGWQGSMQEYLTEMLRTIGIESDITGYYFGLSNGAKKKLGEGDYRAKAYLFDCLHDPIAEDICYPFRTLFEIMFIQGTGSIKRYAFDSEAVAVEHYACEYIKDGTPMPELDQIEQIQRGAMRFVTQFAQSRLSEYVGYDSERMFRLLYQTGVRPDGQDLRNLGGFSYLDNAGIAYLAKPGRLISYLAHPRKLREDESSAGWKVGFFKRLFKLPLPYEKAYMYLWNKRH